MNGFERARTIADAVLYEGYVLYPYRASSSKNQVRFQWGVLMPADVVEQDPSERTTSRSEVVVDGRAAELTLLVRCLQLQRRDVQRREGVGFAVAERLETEDAVHLPWDEAVECETTLRLPLAEEAEQAQVWRVPGGETAEPVEEDGEVVGRLVRTRLPLEVTIRTSVRRPPSPYGVALVAVEIVNTTAPDPSPAGPGPARRAALRRAAIAAHLLLGVEHGAFVSLLDPPRWASGYVEACRNEGTFPVLTGEPGDSATMLSSPIILYDHPQVADESTSVFYDGLEVDELLSLRTMTLSEEEKREVRGTDPRTAALLDEVESMPADLWDRLHGTVRYLDSIAPAGVTGSEPAAEAAAVPWWDPGADASVDPEVDAVVVGDVEVRRGTRVVLRPGRRGADAYDLFLAGRVATVAAVHRDVDEGTHLAVTIDDDPGADLKDELGRYLYFSPDEVEPLQTSARGAR